MSPPPLPPVEQPLPPAVGAPARPAELPNIPGTIKDDRFEVVGTSVFSKQELDATLKDFVGRPLTFAQLLQARSAVSQLYISKGYITSGALIGPQTLTGSVVRILVLGGQLCNCCRASPEVANISAQLQAGYCAGFNLL